jgi:hypothetical protein
MDLFGAARPLADELLQSMRRWMAERQNDPIGVRSDELVAFAQWVESELCVRRLQGAVPEGFRMPLAATIQRFLQRTLFTAPRAHKRCKHRTHDERVNRNKTLTIERGINHACA